MLLVVSALGMAAEKFTIDAARELFPDAQTYKIAPVQEGLTLRLEGCPCVVVPDSRRNVRYIFLLPTEKGKRSHKAMEKARPTAERLAECLKQSFGNAELTPFADGESGYAIALDKSLYESYSSAYLGQPTVTVIDKLRKKNGLFYRCENSEVILKMPCPEARSESCFVSLSLFGSEASVIGFMPGRTARRADEKAAASAENMLNLRSMYTAATSPSYAARLKDLRSATGATKCIAVDSEGTGMVSYRNRYYIGTERNLKNCIRHKKRASRGDKFQFPQASASIPEMPAAAPDEPVDNGPGRPQRRDISSRTAASPAVPKATDVPAPPPSTRSESPKPLSPDAALKDYIEYLRRLMK